MVGRLLQRPRPDDPVTFSDYRLIDQFQPALYPRVRPIEPAFHLSHADQHMRDLTFKPRHPGVEVGEIVLDPIKTLVNLADLGAKAVKDIVIR